MNKEIQIQTMRLLLLIEIPPVKGEKYTILLEGMRKTISQSLNCNQYFGSNLARYLQSRGNIHIL